MSHPEASAKKVLKKVALGAAAVLAVAALGGGLWLWQASRPGVVEHAGTVLAVDGIHLATGDNSLLLYYGELVKVDGGCLAVKHDFGAGVRLVAWPHGSTLSDDGHTVRSDGRSFKVGDVIEYGIVESFKSGHFTLPAACGDGEVDAMYDVRQTS